MLIALFCWASSVSGQKLYATQTAIISTVLSPQVLNSLPEFLSYEPAPSSKGEIRRKAPGKLLLLLPRVQPCPSSLLSPAPQVPAYTLATALARYAKPQWQIDLPLSHRLQQINWALHSSQQQSRIGGWKNSNILYRGSLTYHS
nr:hypothetical protein [Chania multitudinisentens]